MKISIMTLSTGEQVIGPIIKENVEAIVVDYPLAMMVGDPQDRTTAVHTMRYAPFGQTNIVTFFKTGVVSEYVASDDIAQYYCEMVEYLKNKPLKIEQEKHLRQRQQQSMSLDELFETLEGATKNKLH